TEHEGADLSLLYAESLRSIIGGLKDGGQLVMCLVGDVMTGQVSPAITHEQFVRVQIESIAAELGKDAGIPHTPLGAAKLDVGPPYYWRARALNRVILHYRFWKRRRP